MIAMQAITTKYHGATDTKGSRISATTASGIRKYINYPHEFSGVNCHAAAAEHLARNLGWLRGEVPFDEQYVAGATESGYVFVQYK